MNPAALTPLTTPIDLETLISGWLHEKLTARSGSRRTYTAYQTTLAQFRTLLHAHGLDLDRHELADLVQIELLAQAFASSSVHPDRQVKPATQNQRLAILSSFYAYAQRKHALPINPIDHVARAKVQPYAESRALDTQDVANGLRAIDQTTQRGQRDYALLTVLLHTGRRLQEVATLQLQHLTLRKGVITIFFAHCKGGKKKRDRLSEPVSRALLTWLHSFYGPSVQLGVSGDARPVWVSLSQGGKVGKSFGRALGPQAIADVCEKWLGTSKVHATRHTHAHAARKAGASLEELQRHLGHESLATTGLYVQQLEQEESRYSHKLDQIFGID